MDKPIFYVDGSTTVCLLADNGEVVARGLSICSRADYFDPKEGRRQALGRARKAIGIADNCEPIDLDKPRAAWVDKLHMSLAVDRFGYYKGYYLPELTPTEYMIVQSRYGNRETIG